MRQVSALPVRIIDLDPANLGTADAALFGMGDNGLDYCIKTVEKTPAVPAAELVCHALAEGCGIPVPQYDIVTLPDGSHAFGSVWDATAATKHDSIHILLGRLAGKRIEQNVARIFVLDMFVHNIDRHFGNYLCIAGRTPGYTIKAYDFSRAFTAHAWPLPNLPMDQRTLTMLTIRQLRSRRSVDMSAGEEVIAKIAALPFAWFKALVEAMPKTWMNASTRSKVTKWWASNRAERLQLIRDGMKNGSLF
jgi:hypothetical protein